MATAWTTLEAILLTGFVGLVGVIAGMVIERTRAVNKDVCSKTHKGLEAIITVRFTNVEHRLDNIEEAIRSGGCSIA